MTKQTVAVGDTETIVPANDVGQDYFIKADANDARLSKSRVNAEDGNLVQEGDRVIVSIPANEELNAYGEGGGGDADLLIYPSGVNNLESGADLQYQYLPASKVEVSGSVDSNVTDRQGRNLGKARLMDSGNTLIDAGNPFPVEQQTPVGLEDAGGTQVDPREQPDYTTEYTDVDENTAATTTIYDPTADAEVAAVHVHNPGSTAELELQVTDGTDTATLAAPGAGNGIHHEGTIVLDSADSLQVEVVAAEGSAQTETAAVHRGEI